jgi:hypothetical protein
MSDYVKGQAVRCRGLFTTNDSTGVGVDPPTVSFRYRKPVSGTMATLVYGVSSQVVKIAAGAYYCDLNTDEAGTWEFRWDSAGQSIGAGEGVFTVAAGNF